MLPWLSVALCDLASMFGKRRRLLGGSRLHETKDERELETSATNRRRRASCVCRGEELLRRGQVHGKQQMRQC